MTFPVSPSDNDTLDSRSLELTYSEIGDDLLLILDLFLRSLKQRIDAILIAMDQCDNRSLANQAHTLKGSAGNVGACALQEISLQLELLGRNGNAAPQHPLASQLLSTAEQTIDALERVMETLKANAR
ncbi:MAG: Hpt domain-containing protein [Magnetococcales bacterium]|nr:Hpt domain-containing protein [Magnetococcales bacterium]